MLQGALQFFHARGVPEIPILIIFFSQCATFALQRGVDILPFVTWLRLTKAPGGTPAQ